MESVRLWRNQRNRVVGVVRLEGAEHPNDKGRLSVHIDDEHDRKQVTEAFQRSKEVTVGWVGYEGSDLHEIRAKPMTPNWFHVVVINVLYPLGYQADFGVTE
jgi:hypothetical protein